MFIPFFWPKAIYALVWPLVVIINDVLFNSLSQVFYIVLRTNVNILCFEGTPKSFNSRIIQTSASAIHTNLDSRLFCRINPLMAGELRTLVRIDYFLYSRSLRHYYKRLLNVSKPTWA